MINVSLKYLKKSVDNFFGVEKVIAPKEKGGLGLGSLRAFNLTLIVKWWWDMKNNRSALWRRVVMGIHNLKNKPAERLSKKTIPGVWNNIAGVKDGGDTLFWMDAWCDKEPLRKRFPELFQMERRKSCTIKERIHEAGPMWKWRSPLTTDDQVQSLQTLLTVIGDFRPTSGMDNWKCTISNDGKYHVHDLRSKLDNMEPASSDVIIPWIHDIPIKVLTFIWRANLGRIPSNKALIRRGVPGIEAKCSQCLQEDEDTTHILIRYPMAIAVWELVFKWCAIPQPQLHDIGELISFFK
uniref:Reverse transcriptase zinc-binding domain-containing protein n=1 Tax=Lactuca sativa TaxID=4236 RepID=A0A9R1X6R9_LACSA|nr:hypothetical protein LSAT_V11C700361530 [Lactuca sativa]